MPKRTSVDGSFAQPEDVQRPHLESLRTLSREVDPRAREVLKWNLPVYVRGENTNQWMLQNSNTTAHCGFLRSSSPPRRPWFGWGFESGEGLIKLPYKRELPIQLLKTLMEARVNEFEAQHAS